MALNETNKEETSIIPNDNFSLKEGTSSRNFKLRQLVELKENQIEGFRIRFAFCESKIYFVLKDTYVKLGNKDPSASGRMFHLRNKDKFLPESFRKLDFSTPKGKKTYLTATFDVISHICFRANSKIASDYRKAVGKLHQKLIEGKLSLVPSQEAINLFLQEQQFRTSLLEQRLDQVTSALNQVNTSLKQLQIDSQIEKIIIPETGTISKKQEKTIRFLIKNTDINGVHSNTIYNEFKKKFKIYFVENLLKTDYHIAIAWLNALQDNQKKKAVSKKDSTLDNWVKQEKEGFGGCT